MQQPSPTRGPLVWRDMDQKTLDDAYNQAAYAPNMDLILSRIAAASEATREILGAPYRLAYGPSEDERLDVYRTHTPHPCPLAGKENKKGRPSMSSSMAERGSCGSATNRIHRRSDGQRRRTRGADRFHQCRPDRR